MRDTRRPPRSRALLLAAVCLAAAALVAPTAAARPPKPPKEVYQRVTFPQKKPLSQLPGAAILNPKQSTNAVSITLTPTIVEGPSNGPKLFKFTTMAYVDDATGTANVFGPTLRVKRGAAYVMKVTNALVQATQAEEMDWIHNPSNTNMHTHGMHAEIGVPDQNNATTYITGDNIFFKIKARNSTLQPPEFKIFNLKVPTTHMPGMLWYHPHQHGSTALQVGTAHGVIIIEDDNDFWLPPPTGCAQFRSVIEAADDIIFDIQLFFFKTPVDKKASKDFNYSSTIDYINNGPYQYYSKISQPVNAYGVKGNAPTGKATTANKGRGLNVLLVNGGYQPTHQMPAGVWQRWRILYSGIKGFMIVSFYDAKTNKTTDACEMQLYAKDGVYLMQLPRRIGGIFLAAANRAEVLVKCSGPPGAKYVVTTRDCQPFSDDCFGYKGDNIPVDRVNHIGPFMQDVLWTVELVAPPTPPPAPLTGPIVEKACTPKRASYVADLRDDALNNTGFNPANVHAYGVGYAGLSLPDSPKPADAYYYACGYNNGTVDDPGHRFEIPDSDPLVLELGKVVQWNFLDLDFHPMHVHINPYQIQALNDTWLFPKSRWTSYFEVGDWHDTLTLPMINIAISVTGLQLPLRIQPGQFSGYTVSHCHYLMHEDVGCMKVVWFKCPSQDSDKQFGPCPNFTFPVPGTVPEAYD